MHAFVTVYVWRSEVNFWEWILFVCYVDPGDQTQVIKLGGNRISPLSYLLRLCFVWKQGVVFPRLASNLPYS